MSGHPASTSDDDPLRIEGVSRGAMSILDAIGQAVIATDLEGEVTYWSPAAEALYGWATEEAIGRPIFALTPAASVEARAHEVMSILREEGSWTGEFELSRKDGSSFTGLVTNTLVRDADGTPVGIVGVSSDISDLKKTEFALRERIKELRILILATEILSDDSLDQDIRLQRVVERVPEGWLKPRDTGARLIVHDTEYRSTSWAPSEHTLSAPVVVGGREAGSLEVSLTATEHTPAFLPEERELLGALARAVGETLTRGREATRLRRVVDSLEEAVFVLELSDDRRPITTVNAAAARIFGCDRVDLEGARIESLHPDGADFGEIEAAAVAALQAGGVFHHTSDLVRRNGELFRAEQTVSLLHPDRGLADGLVYVVRDVSEQETAREQLTQARERLEAVTREISDAIYVLDGDARVTYAASSVERVTDFPIEDFVGIDALSVVHPDDRDRVRAHFAWVAASLERSARIEYRFVDRDGSDRHVESLARNLTAHPGIGGILVTTRDVTERVAMERALTESQRLEAIGRLAGGIAHDFNNLLTIIRSQTSLVRIDTDDPELNRELEVIEQAGDRAAELTGQLLAFSREQILQPRAVSLCSVVDRIGTLVERIIGSDVKLESHLHGDLPTVELDPAQLEQVLLNLAINARDAMPGGGTLRLETRRREIGDSSEEFSAIPPGSYVELVVADTGVGMEPEVASRAFEPFFTTKTGGGGTGLGLATAYGFVRQTGGDIALTSQPGRGTTFRLVFPTVDRPVSAVETVAPTPSGDVWLSGRVAIIEDQDAVRRVSIRVLERSGLEVEAFATGEEVIEFLEAGGEVDALLTDVGLPGISGRDVLDWCREQRPDLPVAVMSGYAADSPGGRRGIPSGIDYLPKPFTPEQLVETVRRMLTSSDDGA